MLGGGISGDLDGILEQLRRLEDPDLRPLAEDVAKAIVDGNREGLIAGTDADGRPMVELADSTYKRGREGLGPPTVPRFSGSQLIDRFEVKVEPSSGGKGFRINCGWRGVPQVKYFKSGTKNMPARNPVGIRPETREKIRQIINDFARKMVAKF